MGGGENSLSFPWPLYVVLKIYPGGTISIFRFFPKLIEVSYKFTGQSRYYGDWDQVGC